MKIPSYLAILALVLPAAQAALTYTEDFSSGNGFFTTQNSTNTSTSSGSLEFGHSNVFPTDTGQSGQGAGVALDPLAALGSPLSDLLLDTNNQPSGSVFFEFTSLVPETTTAAEEIGFYLGTNTGSPSSSAITQGGTQNAFTAYINDGDLFVADNVNGSTSPVLLLSNLAEDSAFTVSIELSLVVPMGANPGEFAAVYGLTATSGGMTASGSFNGTSQNLNATSLDNFDFVVSTTRSVVGTLDDFTVSNMPIGIPEPSTILLSLVGISALVWRRRKN